MRYLKKVDLAPPWHWGIIRRKACSTLLLDSASPDYEPMWTIYRALKQAGYRETYWQFVYDGQIGGLIRNPGSTLIEFHVRFFEGGMIYAEMELGRSVLLHFLTPRCYINCHLIKTIGARLSKQDQAFLRSSTKKYKAMYPRSRSEWTKDTRFVTPLMRKQVRFLTVLSDWRTLALIMFASVVSNLADKQIILPLLTALMVFVYLLAPRRTQ